MTKLEEELSHLVYAVAAATPFTWDDSKFPDCLAYRWPAEGIDVLMMLAGIFDKDLIEVIRAAAKADARDAETMQLAKNVFRAAMDQQVSRNRAL
jgi:hypothetical protein